MKKIFTFLCTLIVSTLFAQTNFEYGHYIDASGNKTETEISEININRFPEKIFARESNRVEEVDLNNLSEVRWGTVVFQKKRFYYDSTLDHSINKMTDKKDFDFVEKTGFLKLLADGDYKLYQYAENGISTFIYENPEGMLVTLEYKRYIGENRAVLLNTNYINQLVV